MTTNRSTPSINIDYIRSAEARIKLEAGKLTAQYDKGLLTFGDLMTELHTIDDARIYEEEAAKAEED